MKTLLPILLVFSSLAVAAPSGEGALSGVVRDASGATVPSARVTVAQTGSDRREFAITKETGDFYLSPLPEGTYTVTVAKEGFALNRQEGIEVSAARPARLEIVLNLGRVREAVTVTASRTGPAAPPPAAGGVPTRIRVGGSVQATKLVAQTRPLYPPACKAEGVAGTVLLRAVISMEGSLLNVTPVNRLVDARLVEAALDAVRTWRYQPTLLNGQPVEVITEIEVNFTLAK
ncbi:MAG: TonB family protein [Acidobacteria bacterium]|nr:TonB family protein [Acidobacteriota bacterium]